MAEGGDLIEFGYDDPYLDHNIDNDDDEQEVDRTQPFVTPQHSSTPYHGGEQIPMQTMHHEQSGLPSFDERSPLLSVQQRSQL